MRASIERTDRMLVFMGPVNLVVGCQRVTPRVKETLIKAISK
jgi:hypothetical protein